MSLTERYGDRSLKLHVRRMRELLYSPDVPILSNNVVRPTTSSSLSRSEALTVDDATQSVADRDKSKKKRKKRKNKSDGAGRKNGDSSGTVALSMCSAISKSSSNAPVVDPEYLVTFLSGADPMFDVKLDIIDRIVKSSNLSDVEFVKQLTIPEIGVNKPNVSQVLQRGAI